MMESTNSEKGCEMRYLLTTSDVARMLGVTDETVRTWNQRGRIPRPIPLSSNRFRWLPETVETWIKAGCPDNTKSKG